TAQDVGLMLQAVAGPTPEAPLGQPVAGRDFAGAARATDARGVRVAYCPDIAGIGIDTQVERVCRDAAFALRDAGATVDEIELDLAYGRKAFLALRGLWFVSMLNPHLDKLEQFGVNVANNLRAGLNTTVEELGAAEAARKRIRAQFAELFTRYDHLLTPTMAVSPFPVVENYPQTVGGRAMETYVDWIAPTFVLSLTGLPVGSVPAGLDHDGMPCGLQVVGRPFGEESILATMAVMQRLRPIGRPGTAVAEGLEEGE
ncbi:MAG TPA: amidase family protein, partial [Longimicrobium sp.]|nr:amidase family protein [Longimicrobium sp.]